MISRNPVLLPTSHTDWELWGSTRLRRVDDPEALNGQPLHFALPLDYCRSFPLLLPTKDRKLFRDLIYSQLEKRHLVSPTSNARYDFEAIDRTADGTLVRVDFVHRDLPRHGRTRRPLVMPRLSVTTRFLRTRRSFFVSGNASSWSLVALESFSTVRFSIRLVNWMAAWLLSCRQP